MVEIVRLKEHKQSDQLLLGEYGYSSKAKYTVTKEEKAEATTINILLVELEFPYNKLWPLRLEDFDYYAQIIPQGLSLGAYIKEELVGVAICNRGDWNNTLWVNNFQVSSKYRRQGVGRRLMENVFDQAREMGFRVVALETQNTNVPAVSFYYSLGFELDGIDLSFYSNNKTGDEEIAFFMKRKVF